MDRRKNELKAPYKCYFCEKEFTEDGEEVYNICNLILTESGVDGMLHWRFVQPEDNWFDISYFFHRSCFFEVAGVRFLASPRFGK